MNKIYPLPVRLAGLLVGFLIAAGTVYEAGIWLVPFTDGLDKAILSACNPKSYLPGFDQFFRALTDYTNFLILAPMLSWLIAYALYRRFPRFKQIFTNLLGIETLLLAALCATGAIWPNKVYVGANVLLVIFVLAAFGGTAYVFHVMTEKGMRRFAAVLGLMLLSGAMTDWAATGPIKNAVARPRPFNEANSPWNLSVRPIPDELLRGRNSYPSGHTSGTFALLTPLFWYVRSRRARAGIMTWCVLQGFSRVYTAAHFPFCVLMGGILGFTVGTLVFFLLGGTRLASEEVPLRSS